jgi:hypothetical protein
MAGIRIWEALMRVSRTLDSGTRVGGATDPSENSLSVVSGLSSSMGSLFEAQPAEIASSVANRIAINRCLAGLEIRRIMTESLPPR